MLLDPTGVATLRATRGVGLGGTNQVATGVGVDDEPAIHRFLRVSLSAHGYAVFEADGGQSALSAITAERPDLIILDLGLLLREVWGLGYEQEMHMLRVNISNLRRKIEPNPTRPQYLLTEPGVGYRLRASA